MAENDELSLNEAADLLQVHPDTLRAWADDGKVPVWRSPGGRRRFRRRDLEEFKPWIADHPTDAPKAAS